MRRLATVALAIWLALPACAQRGAHASFAPHAAAPMHSSPAFRPGIISRPAIAPQRYSAFPARVAPASPSRPLVRSYPRGVSPVRPGAFYQKPHPTSGDHHRRYFANGRFIEYPVVVGPSYWPYYDLNDGFVDQPYDDPTYNNISNDGLAPLPPAPDANGYPPAPAGYAPEPPQSVAPSPQMQYVPGSADKVTLIFKDGRPPEEIQNYLATPTTITVIDGHHRREIRVSDLDVPATMKANEQTGVDFRLPSVAK